MCSGDADAVTLTLVCAEAQAYYETSAKSRLHVDEVLHDAARKIVATQVVGQVRGSDDAMPSLAPWNWARRARCVSVLCVYVCVMNAGVEFGWCLCVSVWECASESGMSTAESAASSIPVGSLSV